MFQSDIHDLNSGFAIDLSSAADSRSPLRGVCIFVDFPNVPAGKSEHPDTDFYRELLIEDGLAVFRQISFGKLRKLPIQIVAGNDGKHRITKKLQPLVTKQMVIVRSRFVGVRRVHHCLLEIFNILKMIADPIL